jgi:general secretion pathway protein J
MTSSKRSGFTLIEVLVAMAITAVIGVIAYSAIATAIAAHEVGEAQMQRLRAVSMAVNTLSRDINQLVNRGVRDQFGEPESAFRGADDEEQLLTLTRSGWQNHSGAARSQLQRVSYYREDDVLWRRSWPVLDRTTDSEPVEYELLEQVERVQIRYLAKWPAQSGGNSAKTEWLDEWDSDEPPADADSFPIAVEITVEIEELGEIVRLLEIAAGQPGKIAVANE